MALDFKAQHNIPFIYDTHQLARELGVNVKNLWLSAKKCDSMYRPITVKKKNGGIRKLNAPQSQLRNIQRLILTKILYRLPVSEFATAYIRGKELKQNAHPHTNKKYVLKMDITDFFGSIRFEQIYAAAFNTRYFPKQIGMLLTTLCCLNDVLPQGAATSPALSNLVMKNFDENVGSWCRKRGIAYTRYCDDITFSSDKPLYHVFVKTKTMLEDMGFEINKKKTHFITSSARQSVTGLTVNDKVAVPKEYKRRLRQEVYYALKYGLAESILHSDKNEHIKNYAPDTLTYYKSLVGKMQYVLQIEPDNKWFKDALFKFKTGEMISQI